MKLIEIDNGAIYVENVDDDAKYGIQYNFDLILDGKTSISFWVTLDQVKNDVFFKLNERWSLENELDDLIFGLQVLNKNKDHIIDYIRSRMFCKVS